MQFSDQLSIGEAASATLTNSSIEKVYDSKFAGLYDLEETLGSGHFAVVKLARHVFTGMKVAIKVVDKTKLDEISKSHIFQEVRCMKLVQHPNIVRLYEVIDTQKKLYLVLELGDGGDLYDYIMKHDRGLSEELARKYFRQILEAISYCHHLHVVHRDLKPENVVFFEKLGVVKITDFGFSNMFSPGQKLDTFCGSLAYSAPEILLGDSYDAPAVDIWSLGVILYMLVCGQAPFEKANDSETLTMIMDCKYKVPRQISKDCRNLIASILVREPKERATTEQIFQHSWLKQNSDIECKKYLPLVKRDEVSDEDHKFIVQKMVNGNIACREEILKALEKNNYDHITATYFLLAEMKLHQKFEKERLIQTSQAALSNPGALSPMQLESQSLSFNMKKLKSNKNLSATDILEEKRLQNHIKTEKRSRKCSIVREEDEEETAHQDLADDNELNVICCGKESISESLQTHKNYENFTKKSELNNSEAFIKNLNFDQLKLSSTCKQNPVLTQRRSKQSKIQTPSCSSSEASDDDSKTTTKKKLNKFVGDYPIKFKSYRRDSYDDSSDSQEPSVTPDRNTETGNSSNLKKRNESQNQRKQQSNNDERKSSHSHRTKKSIDNHKSETSHIKKKETTIFCKSQFLSKITENQEFDIQCRLLKLQSCLYEKISPFHLNLSFTTPKENNCGSHEKIYSTQLNNSFHHLIDYSIIAGRNKTFDLQLKETQF